MMKVELVIQKNKELPAGAVAAIEQEFQKRLLKSYPDCRVAVRLGAQDNLSVLGVLVAINQVDNLRLADNDTDEAPMDQNSSELSGSIGEWRQNLAKSWRNFMADFITI
ncbi:uroporphyrinogen-III C-methyltransferase, partial [Streptomyces werraensis]|uniref:uroporphyrinogen-III C-methyltransferase n=1 Tax=Streptomyces werraensis TaxID=68284 RepID=UPI0033A8302D